VPNRVGPASSEGSELEPIRCACSRPKEKSGSPPAAEPSSPGDAAQQSEWWTSVDPFRLARTSNLPKLQMRAGILRAVDDQPLYL
jgi:hypothetical protein